MARVVYMEARKSMRMSTWEEFTDSQRRQLVFSQSEPLAVAEKFLKIRMRRNK